VRDSLPEVYVVAIAELKGAVDVEAAALATDLGVTAYEARLSLAPGTPAVVLRTGEREQALHLLARLRSRGHGAVACDASAVVASGAMTSMRRFRLGPSSILLDDGPGQLPYADVSALIAAVHRRHTADETVSRDRTISVARAVISGGLVMTRTVKRETRPETTEREPVLYVFHRGGGVPWLLRERGTLWAGHGRPISPLSSENFRTTVSVLRERAPDAVYDDRLVAKRSAPERLVVSGHAGSTTTTSSSEGGIDLFAHLLALWVTGAGAGARASL
jgi:hypothetical protein